MPEVVNPKERVGALVLTLPATGIQIKRAAGAVESVITWDDATGSLTLTPGATGGAVVKVAGAGLEVAQHVVVRGGSFAHSASKGIVAFVGGRMAFYAYGPNPGGTSGFDFLNYSSDGSNEITALSMDSSTGITMRSALTMNTGGNAVVSTAGTTPHLIIQSVNGNLYLRSAGGSSPIVIGDNSAGYVLIGAPLLSNVDNSFDIGGTTGTNRFRDLFLARNAAIGGTLNVNGGAVNMTGPTLSFAQVATTGGGVTGSQQVIFTSDSGIKWRIGNNVDGSNTNAFQIYDEGVGPVFAVAKTTGQSTFIYQTAFNTGLILLGGAGFSANRVYADGSAGVVVAGGAGSASDFLLANSAGQNVFDNPHGTTTVRHYGAIIASTDNTWDIGTSGGARFRNAYFTQIVQAGALVAPDLASPSGGVDLTFHNGATLVATFSGTSGAATFAMSAGFQNFITVNRGSVAGLLGYYGVFRVGAAKYYLGLNAADNGCIMNAAATADNLAWTDAGVFTFRGQLIVQALLGAATDGAIWYDGADFKGRKAGVTKTFTLV